MRTLTLTPDERDFLAQLLDSIIAEHSAALAQLSATHRHSHTHINRTNVAMLLHSWRSQAADLRERLAGA